MQLQKELLPNFKTANEETVKENVHTAPSYSFAAYCEAVEKKKSKEYFSEEFNLEHCRLDIFGDDNGCECCSGTGWMPVSKANMSEPLRSLWVQAEVDSPAEDGYHLVPCPECSPVSDGLDEHIVKKGSQFELKSKKSGKNLGTYKSKAGAVKRERQVEYFKHLKESENGALAGTENGRPLAWRLHEDSVLPGKPDKLNEELPSEYNKKQSQEKKDKKKNPQNKEKEDPNVSAEDKKEKEKQKRQDKENERKAKKLLPYEFTDQKDAERAAGHLGLHGSHTTGNGVYKPGSSDYALRDAVARKKSKQKMRSGGMKEDVNANDAYPLEKNNCHEDRDYMHSEDPKTDGTPMSETVRKIKECLMRR